MVYTEAQGKEIKMYKSYHCATFVTYEFIAIRMIVSYVYPLMHLFSVEYSKISMQDIFSQETFIFLVEVLHFITIFIIVFSHWIKNTLVHMSLCRYKILAVCKPKEELIMALKQYKRYDAFLGEFIQVKRIFFHLQRGPIIAVDDWNAAWIWTSIYLVVVPILCKCILIWITEQQSECILPAAGVVFMLGL